jgi:hypothetical protein
MILFKKLFFGCVLVAIVAGADSRGASASVDCSSFSAKDADDFWLARHTFLNCVNALF